MALAAAVVAKAAAVVAAAAVAGAVERVAAMFVVRRVEPVMTEARASRICYDQARPRQPETIAPKAQSNGMHARMTIKTNAAVTREEEEALMHGARLAVHWSTHALILVLVYRSTRAPHGHMEATAP